MAFDALSARDVPVSDSVLAQLFTEARTRNGWSDRPVSEDLLRQLYDLTKFGPTGRPSSFRADSSAQRICAASSNDRRGERGSRFSSEP